MALIGMCGFGAVDAASMPACFDIAEATFGGPNFIVPGRYGETAFYSTNTGFGHLMYGYTTSGPGPFVIGSDNQYVAVNIGIGTAIYVLLDGSTNVQVSINVDTSGHVIAYTGGTTTTLGSARTQVGISSGTPIDKSWHHIELITLIDLSAGYITVKVDGQVVLNVTGINTAPSGTPHATGCAFYFADLTGDQRLQDNFYVLDQSGTVYNASIGPQVITTSLPSAIGTNTNWTPTTSPNYSMVNDWFDKTHFTFVNPTPDMASTVIQSGLVGSDTIDTYPVDNFSSRGENNAVLVTIWAASSEASGPRQLKTTLFQSATFYKGSTININAADTNFHPYRDLSFAYQDPATSTNWDAAKLNSFEWGVDNVATGGADTATVSVTQIKIERMGSPLDPFCANHPMWTTG